MDAVGFWERVDAAGDCWEWGGAHTPEGYGQAVFGGRVQGTHRIAYELLVGPIPTGLQLDHLCRNPGCVNPDHLEPVTTRQNLLRSPITSSGKVTCAQGHPLVRGPRYRLCYICTGPKNTARARLRTERRRAGLGTDYIAPNAAKTSCIHGHPFTPENTVLVKSSYRAVHRACRTCRRRWCREDGQRRAARAMAERAA